MDESDRDGVINRQTASWWVELMPDTGDCVYCAPHRRDSAGFTVRRPRREITLMSCDLHLAAVIRRWDDLAER